jgi:hypothetical protein
VIAAAGAAAAGLLWLGGLACACAAAGVSPAAAKAIAHPINLIFTPVSVFGTGNAGPRFLEAAAL